MNYFLAKTDPGCYSIDHLEKERQTVWDGIRNPQALQAIRQMQPGDRVFIYHSQGQATVVGLAEVVSPAVPDPKDAKLAVVEMRFLRRLDPPTSLSEIKNAGQFGQWSLVRQSRLSTMTAPPEFVEWMRDRYPGVDL